jgi:hypothetical protein
MIEFFDNILYKDAEGSIRGNLRHHSFSKIQLF